MNFEVIQQLVVSGADINAQDGWTPLHYAVFNKRTDMIFPLLVRMPTAHIKAKDGLTPAKLAHRMKMTNVVELLDMHL